MFPLDALCAMVYTCKCQGEAKADGVPKGKQERDARAKQDKQTAALLGR